MAYRATPLQSGLSPAELLMGRKICTSIPTSTDNLRPSWPYLETLPDLLPGERVRLPDKKVEGTGAAEEKQTPSNGLPKAPNTDTCTTLSSSSPDVQTAKNPSYSCLDACNPKEDHLEWS